MYGAFGRHMGGQSIPKKSEEWVQPEPNTLRMMAMGTGHTWPIQHTITGK